jgi:hypothetical protein
VTARRQEPKPVYVVQDQWLLDYLPTELRAPAQHLMEAFPHVPPSAILRDIVETQSGEITSMRVMDGLVEVTAEDLQLAQAPSLSGAEAAAAAAAADSGDVGSPDDDDLLPECPRGADCPDRSASHRAASLHPCRHGLDCRMMERGDEDHLMRYSHPEPTAEALRPKVPLCADRVDCSDLSPTHRHLFAHLCRFGTECRYLRRRDLRHCRLYWHDARSADVVAAATQALALLSVAGPAAEASQPDQEPAPVAASDSREQVPRQTSVVVTVQRWVRGWLARLRVRGLRGTTAKNRALPCADWCVCV